jgi:hypothetical protein
MSYRAPFLNSEKVAAEKLAVPHSELRFHRELHPERGVDWEKTAGTGVMLSEKGILRLMQLLGLNSGLFDLAAFQKNGARS